MRYPIFSPSRLKERREERQMDVDRLVRRLKDTTPHSITRATYYNWEKGVSRPDVDIAYSIANLLDCDITQFIEWVEVPIPTMKKSEAN